MKLAFAFLYRRGDPSENLKVKFRLFEVILRRSDKSKA